MAQTQTANVIGIANPTANTVSLVGQVTTLNAPSVWWFTISGTGNIPILSINGGTPAPFVPAAYLQGGAPSTTYTVSMSGGGPAGSTWSTAPMFAQSALPSVVQTELAGLTPGETYLFYLSLQVGQTVYQSGLMSFTAILPLTPTPVSTVTPTTVPHMTFPLTFSATNGVSVCDQDSDEDIISCVQAVANCTLGEFPLIPSFGIPDLTFTQMPISSSRIASSIQLWEQRATIDAIENVLNTDTDDGTWGISVSATPQT